MHAGDTWFSSDRFQHKTAQSLFSSKAMFMAVGKITGNWHFKFKYRLFIFVKLEKMLWWHSQKLRSMNLFS
jgi:hypothetical protein